MHARLVLRVKLNLNETLLEQIIEFVAAELLLALLVGFLQFKHNFAFLGVWIIHVWVKEATNLLIVVLETLQDEQLRYNEEDLCVTLL